MSFLKRQIKLGESDIKDIWRRIKTRNFSGNIGLTIKNSIYQFSTNLSGKIGSLIFTIILARLLMPELFGLYSLALSTILIFTTISEMGIGTTLIRFISKELGKKRSKAKSYIFYLGKIKVFLVFFSAFALLISANYIANNFYQKPIFLALLAGILYIVFTQILGFLQSLLQASNYFKAVLKREIVFQISRIILVPLAIVFAIKYSLSDEVNLMLIILFLAFSFFLASLFLFFDVKKIYFEKLKIEKTNKLSKKQKKTVNKFVLATLAFVLSSTFFGNIDRVMLGKFVEGGFIGYYTAAFSLIGAIIPLLSFSATVLFPIFSKLKGKSLEIGFKKSLRLTFLLSAAAFLVTISLAYFVILVAYGNEYLLSVDILRAFSVLLFVLPIIAIYQSYYLAKGKPNKVARSLIIATVLNIILNYILITSLLKYGQMAAVYGAVIATIISKFIYLGGLVWRRKLKELGRNGQEKQKPFRTEKLKYV